MNRKMICYMLGQLIKLEGALMVLPMICSIVYRERESMTAFAVTIIFALAVGFLLTAMNQQPLVILRPAWTKSALSYFPISRKTL